MFLTHADEEISNEFLSQGYIIRPVADFEALKQITNNFINASGSSSGQVGIYYKVNTLNSLIFNNTI